MGKIFARWQLAIPITSILYIETSSDIMAIVTRFLTYHLKSLLFRTLLK